MDWISFALGAMTAVSVLFVVVISAGIAAYMKQSKK